MTKIGSLFSGYGGLDLGVIEAIGGRVVWHVEFDKNPSAILEHNFPGVPNYGDVTKVDWSSVEPIDVLTGGFPCQDVSLARIVNRPDLLPTPRATRGGSSTETQNLLPTPLTTDYRHGDSPSEWNRNSPALGTIVHSQDWGRFTPAVERWEQVIGRPAPAPTEPDGKDATHRLSAKFTEWMMGLPDGWITNVPGLNRSAQLKACGNGVVPQQAALAIRRLLNV